MLWLYFFGSLLESKIGQTRFMIVYFVSGLLASIGAAIFYPAALGASGAIMGIVGTTIILMPHQVIYINFIPVPLWIAGIAFAVMDTFGIFIPDGTGNIAHLIGLGLGLLYGIYLKTKKVKAVKRIKKKSHLDAGDMEEYMRSGRI